MYEPLVKYNACKEICQWTASNSLMKHIQEQSMMQATLPAMNINRFIATVIIWRVLSQNDLSAIFEIF